MNRTVTRVFVMTFLVAVAVNFVWEMAQSMLFASMGGWMQATSRCLLASLGDGVIVLTMVAAGWLLFRRVDWFVRPGLAGYVFMAALGTAIAVAIEIGARAAGRWSYTDQMPVIPVVHVGLVPVLQMLVLPPLVFRLAVKRLRPRREPFLR